LDPPTTVRWFWEITTPSLLVKCQTGEWLKLRRTQQKHI